MKVAYLGPEGTVSEESARYFFAGVDCEFIPFRFMADVIRATSDGRADYGVVPIENTIDGSVNAHVDLLVNAADQPIQAEWIYPSVQNLIGYANSDKSDAGLSHIRRVVSIPVATAQCRSFITGMLDPEVEFEPVNSTAEGVRLVKERGDRTIAAIGTRLAAERYGLDLLAENITDHDNNYTRFTLIGKEPLPVRDGAVYKTTILITLPEDYPGALHQVLSAFAWRRINLSRIESRPTKKKLGTYYFYTDIVMSLDNVLLRSALEEISAIGAQVRILGSYPSYGYDGESY
ncbi:prephenate dehydratase [Paenibacillus thermoaerophilus]|uniref:Prephenate dehydratase n=1 Tax=Paenibacillus thermoaerophilus TaxID=1215385 RepID=A0ABW2UYV5_9BACL